MTTDDEKNQWVLPCAALFVVQLSYCVWHILGKAALNGGMSPYTLALYRQSGACAVMLLMSRVLDKERGIRRLCGLSGFDTVRIFVLGTLGFGNIYGFIVALSYVTSFNSALLHPIIPVVSAFFATVTGVERLSFRKALGVLVSAAGAVVVVVFGVRRDPNKEGGEGGHVVVGNAFLLGQCVCMGGLLVLQKSLLSATNIPPTTLTLAYNCVAATYALVFTICLVDPRQEPEAYSFSSRIEIVATLYGAVFGICLIYVLLTWATDRAGPTVVALSMTLQGPLNAILACLFLGRSSFTLGEIGGGALICLGLVVTVLDSSSAKVEGYAAPSPNAARRSSSSSPTGEDDHHVPKLDNEEEESSRYTFADDDDGLAPVDRRRLSPFDSTTRRYSHLAVTDIDDDADTKSHRTLV